MSDSFCSLPRLLSNAKKIHCIGSSEISGLSTIYKTDRAVLLPYGFEMLYKKIEHKNNNGEIIIGFVGRLDIYTKGLDILIGSFEKFHQLVLNSKLWIIGDSAEKNKLQQNVN